MYFQVEFDVAPDHRYTQRPEYDMIICIFNVYEVAHDDGALYKWCYCTVANLITSK
jgi:hypothetical protein